MKNNPSKLRTSKRVQHFTESVIREMTRLAIEYDAINLAQGMPDFEPSSQVKRAAVRAIMGDFNQYEITWGSLGLRKAIAEKALRVNGIKANPETDITVTCGSTEAMVASLMAVVEPRDEVIIPEPFYENYVPGTILAGAKPRFVLMDEPNFVLDEEALKRSFNSHTKAIIINTPNNPTGKVFRRDELKLIADLCVDYDVLAITDEIYEHIIYDGRKHVSIASLNDMHDRSITISGLSKSYSMTGWRLGYAIAEKKISQGIRKVHDFTTVCAPTPLQKAGIEALELPQSYYSKLIKEYQRRRDFVVESLRSMGFETTKPEGAYYILADFCSFEQTDDTEFARNLAKYARVATVPASSFYMHRGSAKNEVRFSFAKTDQTLKEAMGRLERFLT